MAKEDDTQLEAWRLQYPSVTVSWNLIGDPVYCQQFVGEAKNMLYQLKNRMNIAVPKLKSLQDKRSPVPGTTITVMSIFGQDFIEIDAGRAGLPSCSIIILSLPEVIPPMKWYSDGIHAGEVEGIDYIKTYYRLKLVSCNDCAPIDFSICKSDKLALPICHPYTYDATKLLYQGESVPYFQGFPLKVPPVLPDPKNHLIYSLYDSGQAEIIKLGSDSQGSYFLWKAYTEWGTYPPTSITFSRTGLGYLLLKAFIRFQGTDLCKVESIVKVDCCKKDISRRSIKQPDRPGYSGLWWESESGSYPQNCVGQPFMFYKGMKMCEVPSEISISDLYIMACIPVHPVAFYVLPDLNGSCLPFTWTLAGPGIWTPGGKYGEIGYYGCADIDCNSEVTIKVTDRCGTVATVHANQCCEGAGPLSILYTSLLMSCGQSQTLTPLGGCGPHTWSITSGGGTLTQDPSGRGRYVIYTAPATNVNCIDNPTITVTDCCGNSTSISLAINCYVGGYALAMNDRDAIGSCTCFGQCNPAFPHAYCEISSDGNSYRMRKWNCDGTLTSSCSTGSGGVHNIMGEGCEMATCPPGTDWGPLDPRYCNAVELGGCLSAFHCGTNQCGHSGGNCSVLVDERTSDMKNQGCCPLNPITGAPY